MSQTDCECSELEVEYHLELLLPKLQKKIDDYHKKIGGSSVIIGKSFLSESRGPMLVKYQGRKYWKLVLESRSEFGGTSSTVYGFIRKVDGAVFKPAGWKKPETRTKTAIRGFITDEFPEDYFTIYGVIYVLDDAYPYGV